MRNTDTFKQYIWLVNTILRAKKISLEQIQQRWINDDLNEGKPLSRTTFHRQKIAIEEMFGIIIGCDVNDGFQYYIENPETLRNNSTQNWMLQTLTVSNTLNDSLSIKDRLILEEIPSGMEYLQTIIKAMKNNQVLHMGYKKFKDSEGYVTNIKPYCLKVFKQRWYLLGKSEKRKDELAFYALDRITELEETDIHFELDHSFNAKHFFNKFYGVFANVHDPAENIVIRAYGNMIPLLRTLPLHHSQKEIKTSASFSDFHYYLVPTLDFRQAILKEGNELEVIEPLSLREEIKKDLLLSLKHYTQ